MDHSCSFAKSVHSEHIDDVDQIEEQVNERMKAKKVRALQDADLKIIGKTREWSFGENCGVQRREFGGPCVKPSVSPTVDGFGGTVSPVQVLETTLSLCVDVEACSAKQIRNNCSAR
jgi:hypothetical protein